MDNETTVAEGPSLDEQIVLGGAMASSAVADALADIVRESDFAEGRHRIIWAAVRAVRAAGEPASYDNLAANLIHAELIGKAGGVPYLHTCHQAAPSGDLVTYHGKRVAAAGHLRRQEQQADRHRQILRVDDSERRAQLIAELGADMLAEVDRVPGAKPATEPNLFHGGGAFILDQPDTPPAVWGDGDHVIWAEGEALMIAAPQGVGKTTIALQVVRARLGLQDKVLGYSVQHTAGKILYLAMDRPAQMSRAAHRIFTEDDRDILDKRLVVWKGPPPADLAVEPGTLARMCAQADADTVIVDSVKDGAIGLSDDKVGAGYNRARQQALADGVQVLELHHTVKRGTNGSDPNTLADVYGSTWLTSGAGSVVSLWGDAGDPVISWRHLKQPAQEIGPFRVNHDHDHGVSEVEGQLDVLLMVRRAGVNGLTAANLATALFERPNPTRAQVEKARRRLDKKADTGLLSRVGGERGGPPAKYFVRLAG